MPPTTTRGGAPTRPLPHPLPFHPGNTYLPFSQLIALESLSGSLVNNNHPDDSLQSFLSISPPFAPGGPLGTGRSYGGHVLMQAAWAAAQTLEGAPSAAGGAAGAGGGVGGAGNGFLLHSISGNFLLPGKLDSKFEYRVKTVRNGKGIKVRGVEVFQESAKKGEKEKGKEMFFIATCSFKLREHSQISIQQQEGDDFLEDDFYGEKVYGGVLQGKKDPVRDLEEVPGMDLTFYRKQKMLLLDDDDDDDEEGEGKGKGKTKKNHDAFPGLQCRKVDMREWNSTRHPMERRQLIFYRMIFDREKGEKEEEEEGMGMNMNMQLCAHLYASDRNSLFIVANLFDLGDLFTNMSSLSHTVIFHAEEGEMRFGSSTSSSAKTTTSTTTKRTKSPFHKANNNNNDDGGGRWFCMEVFGSRIHGGRAVHNCRIFNDEGTHIATCMQDGLIRFAVDPQKPTEEELEMMEAVKRGWKRGRRGEKL